jgi:hypothetical protein
VGAFRRVGAALPAAPGPFERHPSDHVANSWREEPGASIGHARICGGPRWATTPAYPTAVLWAWSICCRVRSANRTQAVVTRSISELREARLKDAHHVIQNAAVRDLPGSSTTSAPGVQLPGPSTARGTPWK